MPPVSSCDATSPAATASPGTATRASERDSAGRRSRASAAMPAAASGSVRPTAASDWPAVGVPASSSVVWTKPW